MAGEPGMGKEDWLGHGSLASFHADDVDRELWLDVASMGPGGGISQQSEVPYPRRYQEWWK